jgi:predicted lipase
MLTFRTTIQQDMQQPPEWPFTCYGHSGGSECLITGDLSPEELRFEAYKHIKQYGNLTQHVCNLHLFYLILNKDLIFEQFGATNAK